MAALIDRKESPDEWYASLNLGYIEKSSQQAPKTIVANRNRIGPLTMQRAFYPEPDGICHTYLLHPPAGIAGNDRLSINVMLEEQAKVLVTNPGATRFYRTNGQSASLHQQLVIDHQTQLEWLPQETLIYAHADAKVSSEIRLHGNGQYFGWEVIGLGRPASGEQFNAGRFECRTQIFRDGELQIRDRIQNAGPPAGLHNNQAFATLFATNSNPTALEKAQQICADAHCLSAPTLIKDILIVRALASECKPISALFRALWLELRPMLFQRPAFTPQIWRT